MGCSSRSIVCQPNCGGSASVNPSASSCQPMAVSVPLTRLGTASATSSPRPCRLRTCGPAIRNDRPIFFCHVSVDRIGVSRQAQARPDGRERRSASWNSSVVASVERSDIGRRRRVVVQASATAACASERRARRSWPSFAFPRSRCTGHLRQRSSRARARWSEGSAGIAARRCPTGRSTDRMSA